MPPPVRAERSPNGFEIVGFFTFTVRSAVRKQTPKLSFIPSAGSFPT
jgi:hypothetical protein